MAGQGQQDFNRSALTVGPGRAWYTGQRAERIPSGLVRVVGSDCVSLDLSYNELTSVSGIKDFLKLEELILDNNNLRDLKTLPRIPSLTTLSLNNNKVDAFVTDDSAAAWPTMAAQIMILNMYKNPVRSFCYVIDTGREFIHLSIRDTLSDIDAVLQRIRECCPKVVYVSLLGNPGCPDQLTDPTSTDEDDYERYRLYAIHCLPQTLRFLDSRPITNQERQNARRRGKFLRTVKFVADQSTYSQPVEEFDDVYFNVNYTPLPSSMRNPQDHKGAFGKCRYRYSGKNSEGNRFISNNDL